MNIRKEVQQEIFSGGKGMKRVLVIMEDDNGGPRIMRYDYTNESKEEDMKGVREHTRDMISRLIAMGGVNVTEASNLQQVIATLDAKGEEIGVALVVEQEAGSRSCLRYIETVRAKCGDRVKVIGVAETIECMEEMQALRVEKLLGAPLGLIDFEGVLKAVQVIVRG